MGSDDESSSCAVELRCGDGIDDDGAGDDAEAGVKVVLTATLRFTQRLE